MPDAQTHYQLLGVSPVATPGEIQRAFRALAKKYHPDVNRESASGELFARMSAAYEVLSDSAKRRDYDRSLLKKRVTDGPERSASDIAQGHYAWVNVAGAPPKNAPDPSEVDEIYDTFFGSKKTHAESKSSEPAQKSKAGRKRAS